MSAAKHIIVVHVEDMVWRCRCGRVFQTPEEARWHLAPAVVEPPKADPLPTPPTGDAA